MFSWSCAFKCYLSGSREEEIACLNFPELCGSITKSDLSIYWIEFDFFSVSGLNKLGSLGYKVAKTCTNKYQPILFSTKNPHCNQNQIHHSFTEYISLDVKLSYNIWTIFKTRQYTVIMNTTECITVSPITVQAQEWHPLTFLKEFYNTPLRKFYCARTMTTKFVYPTCNLYIE